jgi:DNA-binding MarR family transcriptional regulator
LFYNATRRLSVNRPLTGDLVALALLLQARGALSVTQIASALVMNVGSASDFCARAVASGLFVSTRMPGDKRQRIVDLSPTAVQRLTR